MTAPATGVYKYAPKVVRDYLTSVLDPAIRVATDVPANRPTLLVTISTASTSGGDNIALSPRRLIIHCYHPAEMAAGALAETVYAHMQAAKHQPGNGIRNVVPVGTPARFDDPDDSTPRFQMTLDVLLRASF
jgi:hypothetical protein